MTALESRKTYRKAELAQTIKLMRSDDYKERYEAEYRQLNVRMEAIEDTLKHNEESLTPLQLELLRDQYIAMSKYRNILELRAQLGLI